MDSSIIIGAFANIFDLNGRLDQLDREHKQIAELWQRQTSLDFIGIPNAKIEDIFKVLKNPLHQERIIGFHFGGHAGYSHMIFEEERGKLVKAVGKELAGYIGTMQGIKFVFLNGCATAPIADQLLAVGVPVVIATSYEVEDKTAADFAIDFYEELSLGKSIGKAFAAARSQVNIVEGQQKQLQVHAYHREIPLLGLAPKDIEKKSFPWGLYYQANLKPEELFPFIFSNNKIARLKDVSGKTVLLEIEALERAGMLERFKILMAKKDLFEKELLYATDPAVMFNLEYRLKGIDENLLELRSQII